VSNFSGVRKKVKFLRAAAVKDLKKKINYQKNSYSIRFLKEAKVRFQQEFYTVPTRCKIRFK